MTASEGSNPSELPASSLYRKYWGQLLQKLGSVLDASKPSVPTADRYVRGLLAQVLKSHAPRQTWGGGCVWRAGRIANDSRGAGVFRYAIPLMPVGAADKAIASTFGIPPKL